jgi:ferredoxin
MSQNPYQWAIKEAATTRLVISSFRKEFKREPVKMRVPPSHHAAKMNIYCGLPVEVCPKAEFVEVE